MKYDVFICHASEDKADIARPLAEYLQKLGLRVWFDETELSGGDAVRRKIDQGLSKSRYGIVILSPAFISKEWPNKELDGLFAREDGREKLIVPVRHNFSHADMVSFSPMLAGRIAVSTSRGAAHAAEEICQIVRRAATGREGIQPAATEDETELLERLRKEMLLSLSEWELQRLIYQLEAHLAVYPHSPDARLLENTMRAAMRRARRMEVSPPAGWGLDSLNGAPERGQPGLLPWLVVLAVLGGIIYSLLRILGVL
jgi:hypothetical protein